MKRRLPSGQIKENHRRPFPLLDWTGAPDYDEEKAEAEEYINHMRQVAHENTES